METLDMAVVGSGIGGSLIASLHADKNIALFEKERNLGGCASTFKRYGNLYNAGATTLVGYEEGHILKKHFDKIGLRPHIRKSDIAMRVVHKNKVIDRVKDFEPFLADIEEAYPHKNHRIFWSKIKEIDRKFWQLKKIYYGKHSLRDYLKTANFISELLRVYGFELFKSADAFMRETLGDISLDYQDFINAQLLITIQTNSKDISLLSLALGLSYPFHDVYSVNGGMGNLIEDIVSKIEVKRDEAIRKITRDGKDFILHSSKGEYKSKKLILNSSIYQTSSLFEDEKIKKYYDSFSFSDQSAFVLYLTLESTENFLAHYQFIYDDLLPNAISNAFFVSFSQKEDPLLSKNGYSITISTHTKAHFWKSLSKEEYAEEKQKTQDFILSKFLDYFSTVKKAHIKRAFSATSHTFNRYISRYNCGGKAIGFKNFTQLPSTNTPFEGLYNVGDTVFAGQGWPGIAVGVEVLNGQLEKDLYGNY